MQEKNLYSIGQVSKLCNIPVKTLRYYDQIKVLPPNVRKASSNYRYYDKEQLIRAFMIRQLKLRGFKLGNIKELISKSNLKSHITGIERRLEEIEKEIGRLQNLWQVNKDLLQRLHVGRDRLNKYRRGKEKEVFCLENIPFLHLLCSRHTIRFYRNEEVSLERWIEVSERAHSQKLKIVGPVYITFFTDLFGQFFSKECDVEFAIQVEASDNESEEVKQFGGVKAATAIHCGSYGNIFQTYISLKRWIDEHDYEILGHATEQFIVSPLDTRNENEHVTKIIIPVKDPLVQ